MLKLGSRTDKLDFSVEILLLTLELPIPASKRESRWSVSEREVGNREVVKFPGHDLLVLLVDWEWGGSFSSHVMAVMSPSHVPSVSSNHSNTPLGESNSKISWVSSIQCPSFMIPMFIVP